MAETPRFAHLVVLVFLGTACCLAAGTAVLFYGALRKRASLAISSAIGVGGLLLGYFGLLIGVSLLSPEKTLAAGSWKYFCEADCHIAYSVQNSYSAFTLGPETSPTVAKGIFVVVKLKTWFDPDTISRFRGHAPLTPPPRHVYLVEQAGRRFEPRQRGASIPLDLGTPLTTPLRPGESYFTNLIFDVPNGADKLRLLILSDSWPISQFVIDDENSLLHRKIYLGLDDLKVSRH
jgi:hypothetical protein